MASLVAKVNSSSCSSQLSVQEKVSRNKRKFRADPPLSDPNEVLTSALNDGSSYEFSAEKFEIPASHGHPPGPCDMCGMHQDHSDTLKLDLGLSTTGMGVSSVVSVGPSQSREEVEGDEFQAADWNDLTESQLEVLVLSNLDASFKSAIKRIVAYGYTEEIATTTVLRSGLCYGSKDIVSNIVDNAMVILRNGHNFDSSREHCFQDLQQLAKYVLVELVCVLREVRPFFSTGDAMWCLLICDMNVSHACAMDGDPMSSIISDGSSSVSSCDSPQSQSKPESKSMEMSLPKPCKPVSAVACAPITHSNMETVVGLPKLTKLKNSILVSGPNSNKEGSVSSSYSTLTPLEKPFSAGMSQTPTMEEKFVTSRKMHSTSSKREYTLRQKSLHFEKSYRAYGMKGTFRTAKFSGYVLDKRGKPTTDSSSLSLKSASLKISKAMAMGLELAHDIGSLSFSSCSSLSPSSATFTIESQTTVSQPVKATQASATLLTKDKPPVSGSDTELSLSLPKVNDPRQLNSDPSDHSLSGVPYNKSLEQWVTLDKKDEMIIKLVPRIRELQNQLQEWTEWANQKVMQAARRLGKDKAELKTLRQEKEEVERLKKEKQSLEENTMKKLSEMENALGKASGQVVRANTAVRRLEVENAALKKEMEAAKIRAVESAASCQEVSKREKTTLMKFQSWEKEKGILQEELIAERRKLSLLQQELEQAKDLRAHLVAKWKQEEKIKDELLTQANSIRKEREQLEASAKSKENAIRLKAEANLQKYKEDIMNLENEISQLRLKTDSSIIAALKRGIDGSYANKLTNSQTPLALKELRESKSSANRLHDFCTGGVKRERECVMCLSEEMSVVFLPCAHQVVCKMCNELHEKQGMNDCPSCRSPIIRRITVRYARP
ncbi:hypothetical protein KSS87_017785 [Heliosperma pusillum]|nr:hypothetical protein KSS87_017785 [Heliosperma pusillum]